MSLERAYQWLTAIVGRVLAQIICVAITWTLFALAIRLYMWLDGSVAGGIDPVRFAMLALLSLIVFYVWRFFAENDLDG